MDFPAYKAALRHSGCALCIGLLICLIAFYAALPPLLSTWLESPEYGYGIIIPLVVAYIVWDTRGSLFNKEFSPTWLGVAILVLAFLLFIPSILADLDKVKAYSLLLAILGLVMAIGGPALVRACGFPFVLLLLAIPLPYLLTKLLTIELQFISSDIGVAFIRLIGMPVLQEGNIIDLGHFQMLVEEACSGLRYLFPLLSISVALSYFFRAPVWMKIVLVASAAPITILMNSVRIAITAVIIDIFGAQAAEGFMHAFEGWIFFVAAFALLIIVAILLGLCLDKRRRLSEHFILSSTNRDPVFSRWSRVPLPVVAFFLVLIGFGFVANYLVLKIKPVLPEREDFSKVPFVILDRVLQRKTFTNEVLNVLQADDYFLGDYVKPGAIPINVYMAYYEQQRDGAVIHSPKDCLPGGGWLIESAKIESLQYLKGEANSAVITRGQEKLLVYYWVNQHGKNYASAFEARTELLKSALFKQRTDASLVRIIAPVKNSVAESEREIRQFIQAYSPSFQRLLPL
ncbi:MAG: VPLPA-CTERM-specific exosortase XrtD [Cellvibrionaceae bacterium]|nr:VPLPA-CTERM-specific exosortase XrtD [Cellvibrionaceae bacterium]